MLSDNAKALLKLAAGCVLALCLLIGGAMWGLPKYKLYRADIEKRILVSEARAKADAAEYTAEQDRTRAKGVADANKLIDATLTDKYITWYYVDQISGEGDQIIYIPTEGGVPVLEAGRGVAP